MSAWSLAWSPDLCPVKAKIQNKNGKLSVMREKELARCLFHIKKTYIPNFSWIRTWFEFLYKTSLLLPNMKTCRELRPKPPTYCAT